MEKSEKIVLLSTIVVIGFVIATIYHYIMGFYSGLEQPFNSFLPNPKQHFCDFFEVIRHMNGFAPYKTATPWIVYFPPAYLILFIFSIIANKTVSFLLYLASFLIPFIYINIKTLSSDKFSFVQNFQNIFIISFCSYPILFVIDRGNFDMILLILFALFIYMFQKERYMISSLLLGLINAMKPFWLIFYILFLLKKKFKETFFSLIFMFLLIVGGFMIFQGSFFNQVAVYIKSVAAFSRGYIYTPNPFFDLDTGCSLFMALRMLFCQIFIHVPIDLFLKIYYSLSAVIFLITTYFICIEKTFWKQISLLTLLILTLPLAVSHYRLIFLFVPIWLFVNAKEKTKYDLLYTILFALMLVPKNIVVVNWLTAGLDKSVLGFYNWVFFTFSIILNPLIMLLLIGLIIYDRIRSKGDSLEV